MMEREDKILSSCPDKEDLSAFFDNEAEKSESLRRHLDSCEHCRSVLNVYQHMRTQIKNSLEEAYDTDCAQDILKETKRKIALEMKHESGFTLYQWLPRVAALFILGAALIYLLTENGSMKNSESMKEPDVPILTAGGPSEFQPLWEPGRKIDSRDFGTVDFANVKPVSHGSFGGGEEGWLLADFDHQTQHAALIASFVKHVWISTLQTPEDVKHTIAKIVAESGIGPVHVVYSMEGNLLKISVRMTRKQTVRFVAACQKTKDLKLISSEQPQPEQEHFLGNGLEPVNYTATFVCPENN